jgi:hypothetical protein
MDLDSDIDDGELSPVTPRCPTLKWVDYPKSLFPNWTEQQVRRSGISKALTERQEGPCTIYNVDVLDTGKFKRLGEYFVDKHNKDELWEILQIEVIFLLSFLHRISDLFTSERPASTWHSRACSVHREHIWSCIANVRHTLQYRAILLLQFVEQDSIEVSGGRKAS